MCVCVCVCVCVWCVCVCCICMLSVGYMCEIWRVCMVHIDGTDEVHVVCGVCVVCLSVCSVDVCCVSVCMLCVNGAYDM